MSTYREQNWTGQPLHLSIPTPNWWTKSSFLWIWNYTVVKVDGATPKRWRFVRGHDKPIHGSCAIYFPGGINEAEEKRDRCWLKMRLWKHTWWVWSGQQRLRFKEDLCFYPNFRRDEMMQVWLFWGNYCPVKQKLIEMRWCKSKLYPNSAWVLTFFVCPVSLRMLRGVKNWSSWGGFFGPEKVIKRGGDVRL